MAKQLLGLTDFGNDDYGATEAIRYLLQAVGRYVVSFQRNTNVSCMVIERARDIVKAINECIIKVEDSTTGDWESYEKFSNAIEPLESMLFKLLVFADDENRQYLPKTSSTCECVSSVETWAKERKDISEILNEFYTRRELENLLNVPDTMTRESDHQEARFHDDKTLLEEMRTIIKDILTKDSNEFPPYVYDVKTPLDELQNAGISGSPRVPEWFMVITIQTSMLIQGVMKIVEATTDIETRNHLRSKPVWDAASELIKVIKEVDRAQLDLPNDANCKYNAFLKIILASTNITPPESYAMKDVDSTRRPFQAQGITLAMLCRRLAAKLNTIAESADTIENFNSLEAAFNDTFVTLKDGTQAVTDLKDSELSDFEN